MKISLSHSRKRVVSRAFTLPEIMVTVAIFSIAMAGMIASFVFGAKMYRITEAKLGASDQARDVITKFSDEVRSATRIRIGSGQLNSFTEVTNGAPQKGNAVQIYPTTSTNSFVRYYWDSTDNRLKKTTDGTNALTVLANSITNSVVFTSEDYAGNVLTDNQNNRVIGLTLDFDQTEFGKLFDFYRFRTKITRRALE